MPGGGICSHTEEGPCGQWAEGPGARAKLHTAWTGPHGAQVLVCGITTHTTTDTIPALFSSFSPQDRPGRRSSLSLIPHCLWHTSRPPHRTLSSGGPRRRDKVGRAASSKEFGVGNGSSGHVAQQGTFLFSPASSQGPLYVPLQVVAHSVAGGLCGAFTSSVGTLGQVISPLWASNLPSEDGRLAPTA